MAAAPARGGGSAPNRGAKLVFGGGAFMSPLRNTAATALPLLDAVRATGAIDTIDSASNYAMAEKVLGEAGAGRGSISISSGGGGGGDSKGFFIIDTKISGGLGREPATKEVVERMGRESLRNLKIEQVDILYLHAPDRRVPLEDTLSGIDTLYREGAFRRFGLSNYLRDDVEAVFRVCEAEGYAWRPQVYQANYSAAARRLETELLPLLRSHDMAVYGYSPVAGGFLTKTVEELAPLAEPEKGADADAGAPQLTTSGVPPPQGRWHPNHPLNKMYRVMYGEKPAMLRGLAEWHRIAASEGVTPAEMAYRWACHNSALSSEYGDALVIGTKNESQVQEVAEWVARGPLSNDAANRIDEVWDIVKSEAPLDNVNDFLAHVKLGA